MSTPRRLIYCVWRDMIYRCYRPERRDYERYGARGIRVCEEWRGSFKTFLSWAMQNGFEPGLQLDRRNSLSGYAPSNCRFATRQQNQRNRAKPRIASTSRFKGVRLDRGKWSAQIKFNGRCFFLGRFKSEEDAARAYDRAALEHFGEFSRLNFPQEACA